MSHITDRRSAAVKRAAFTMVEVLIVVAVIVVLVAVAFPVTRGVMRGAHNARCLENLKKIGIGMELYLGDHGDRFPMIGSPAEDTGEILTLPVALQQYVANAEVFHCPADREVFARSGSSYFWNPTQSGQHKLQTPFFGTTGQPEVVPLVADIEAFHGDVEGVNILYADYHRSNQVEFRVGPR